MNCSEFQQRLVRARDAHGPTARESAEFGEHLRQCNSGICATLWAEHQMLEDALKEWTRSVPLVDLVESVIRDLHDCAGRSDETRRTLAQLQATYAMVRQPTEGSQRARSTGLPGGQWSWPSLATVATALVMVSLLTLSPSTHLPDPIKVDQFPGESVVVTDHSLPETDQGWHHPSQDLVESYAAMPLSATEFVTDAVALVVPADLPDPDSQPSRAAVWADDLERRWEPVGKELSSAFDVLLKAVPRSPRTSI